MISLKKLYDNHKVIAENYPEFLKELHCTLVNLEKSMIELESTENCDKDALQKAWIKVWRPIDDLSGWIDENHYQAVDAFYDHGFDDFCKNYLHYSDEPDPLLCDVINSYKG